MGFIEVESPRVVRQPDGSTVTIMGTQWISDHSNQALVRSRIETAISSNNAFMASSAGIVAPLSNAQMNALIAQVRKLTQECTGLGHLLLEHDDASGT